MKKRQNNQSNQRDRDPEKERLGAAARSLASADSAGAGSKALNILKIAMGFNDPLNALASLLDNSVVGTTVLRTAFSVTASEEALVPTLLCFFGFLGQDKFSVGTSKLSRDACYKVAYDTAGLMLALTASIAVRSSADKQILAWFLVAVCLSNPDARSDSTVLEMAEKLCSAEGAAIQAMKNLLFPHEGKKGGMKLDLGAVDNLDYLQALNPQHDNDFPMDYRKIQIIPTADEVNADPLPGTALAPRAGPPDEAAILDRQFRLLREDMVAPIVKELNELKAANAPHATRQATAGAAHQKRRLYPNPMLVDVGVDQFCAYVLLLVPIPPHLKQRLHKMKPKERVEFCTEGPGRRILARDSLLLFLNADYSVGCTGRVVRNDKKEFLRYDGYFCIGVQFENADLSDVLGSVRINKLPDPLPPPAPEPTTREGANGRDHAKTKGGAKGGRSDNRQGNAERSKQSGGGDKEKKMEKPEPAPQYPPVVMNNGDAFAAFLFQTNSSVFAYEPILRSLQSMVSIPFKHELVQQRPSLPLPAPVPLSDRAAAALADDPNQREAVLSALKQRVCLIQGPPGTGKTYVGVQIVRALLDQCEGGDYDWDIDSDYGSDYEGRAVPEVRILCLCYTNHALDDFLLSVHEEGGVPLKDIVRLGRSPKIHEKLKSRTLDERGGDFNRLQAKKFAIAKSTMQRLETDINTVKEQIGRIGGSWTWKTASAYLAKESAYDVDVERIYEQLQSPSIGGFHAAARPDDLWRQWISGGAGRGAGAQVSAASIWAMSLEERRAQVRMWQHQQAQLLYDGLARDMEAYNKVVEELQLLKTEPKVPAAARAKVLGCTTTSAAKNREILAQIRPNVVIVEEAGEILEASTLTCLGPSVKHLIMIGDHKQLRPKLECYWLRKESGQGINFDVSLFERLAVSSFPMITLNEQRRMRPEICDLIRLTTYPELKDHKSVQDREPARGVSSNVIFIDHNHPENDDTENAVLNTSSKVNRHEVGMVREIVRYFLRQGYQSADMVVLTPYLGQLALMQDELKKIKIDVDVNELDRQELQNADIDIGERPRDEGAAGAPPRSLGVKVATVDNFQGEEAKIIIGSLVRCNDRAEIGFVAGAERINVMLSRARDAFVLLGSADTLCNARRREGTTDWPGIIAHLRRRGQVFPGFPAVCSQHKRCPSEPIDAPEKFDVHAPCGGCARICGLPLLSCPHGHSCASFCHPIADPVTGNDVHRTMQCHVVMQELCKNGHEVERKCYDTKTSRCTATISAKCPAGLHFVQQPCFQTVLKDCHPCKVIATKKAKQAELLAQESVKQNEALARERDELYAASAELLRAEQESDHVEALRQLQLEKKLVVKAVGEAKKPRSSELPSAPAYSAREPASATTAGHPIGTKASASHSPAMEVPDDFSSIPFTSAGKHAKNTRAVPGTKSPVPVNEITCKATSQPDIPAPTSRETSPPKAPRTISTHNAPSKSAFKENSGGVVSDRLESTPKAPAKKSAAPTRFAAEARLSEVLKLADAEAWMKLLSLPELPAPTADAPHSDHFAHLAVQAIFMLAEEQELRAHTGTRKIGSLVESFNKLNDSCETGCVNDALVFLVVAVLQYVKFVFFSKETDLQQSAKQNADAFALLLQVNARQELFQQIPKAWKAEATNFKPAPMPRQLPPQKTIDPNCAEERWTFCKKKFLASPEARKTDGKTPPRTTPSESIDILLTMTGLESVKRSIIGMYERLQIAKLQGGAEVGTTFNLRCDGNPGTGKTTVARLFASFLVEVGILPEKADIHETSGSKLISDGVKGLTKTLEDVKEKGGGGVMFVDETYQLNPMPGSPGGQVFDFILPLAEKMNGPYGKIVWVFAGYTNKMDKLFEHNPGLPSRFPHRLLFEDYTDAELLSIMNSVMQHGGKDVGAAPKKAPPPPAPKPTKSSSIPVGAARNTGMYGGNPYSQAQPDRKDKWGNKWSYNPAAYTWEDDFNNISGLGVDDLGSINNPLISRDDNSAWRFDNYKKHWYRQQDPSTTQTWYPGSPAPPPPLAAVLPVKPFTADPKWVRVAITRLGRSRGKVGFGNARAVRILFDQTHSRQAMRLTSLERQNLTAYNAANKMEFLRDDLLGPKADAESLKSSCAAWKKLQAMTGLKEVKESLEKLVELAVINSDLEDDEQPVRGVVLNRIFLGNPGTGKTTVAALYGQILCHLGLLSKGEVVLKNSSDFVGSALGTSESQTRGILAASEGCVLVIDEAYSLNPSPNNKGGTGLSGIDPYKTAVVDTIVEQVQGRPGEDRAVVMLGYRREMEDFLAKANPGLSRRFQMENAFEFVDYDDDQLVKILRQTCSDEKLSISVCVAYYAVKQLARARSLPNFGNAGALNNLLSTAKLNMGNRRELVEADFHVGGVVPVKTEESTIFDDLVGCDNVLAELKSLQSSIKFAQKRGKDIKSTFESSFLFVGGPGTGKTTVARKMGVMFHSLGLLPTPDVMEIKAADLTTVFSGQASHKTTEVIGRAKGKVLFIDEAYQLNPAKGGQFMQEAVDTMVKALTSEELQGQLVVILAGYEKEIDDMLRDTNPGLRSRFSKKIVFEDFTPQHVESILRADLAAEKVALSTGADEQLGCIAADLCKIHEFSNGRDAKTLVKRIMKCYAERIVDEEDEPDLELEDLRLALESMQKSRLRDAKAAASGPAPSGPPVHPPQYQFQDQFAPPPSLHVVEMLKEMDVEQDEEEEVMDEVEETDGFSPGSTAFLRTLQDLLDQQGLNSQAGVRRLAHMGLKDPYMQQLAYKIAELTGTDVSGAQELLREWQQKQEGVEEKEAEMEKETAKAKQEKRKALLPIWRCAVCGRANMPYIACYVSPYICEYREVDVM